ncbi:transcription factor bHLH91-like [Olea europaea subsp. europaea]|uniref:Transcription factor bHLH91-like n=1 Tax=Olea europaea subsp. europaea TaxID=158383 RepID=A0A8S0RVY0_OLEEU|nr:transcription factor bHLH91-like [Olea europaea subsp. europaea]CAA2983515.1 transcription factor bHLH91-like [Olea europaea subsp. europaea]
MYEGSGCFDPSNMQQQEGLIQAEDAFSQTHIPNCSNPSFSMEEHSNYPLNHPIQQDVAAAVLEMELQQQIIQQGETHLMQEILHDSNWQDMSNFNGNMNQYSLPETPYTTTPDLLNMFSLPRCSPSTASLLPNSSISFPNSAHKSPNFLASVGLLGDLNPVDGASASASATYDPLLPLNLPPQPPFLRDLLHSLPHGGYATGGSRTSGSLFPGMVDERDVNGGDGRHFDNGVFVFNGDMDCIGKNKNGKDTKHFATERGRRVLLNDKFKALRSLVPNPIKNDRASIVGDAIDYINELKRTVNELNVMVEKKRCSKERLKRTKREGDTMEGNIDTKSLDDMGQPYNGSSLRSSWLHRKSKNTEVDVRIVDDEVTVKLVQQKRTNCLLLVSKVLEELQLDLNHVAGGLIGDYYSFLFNSKICEGSIVYASAIANKLIEVVDKQYAAIPPTNSY